MPKTPLSKKEAVEYLGLDVKTFDNGDIKKAAHMERSFFIFDFFSGRVMIIST